jgi:hypothetical protein
MRAKSRVLGVCVMSAAVFVALVSASVLIGLTANASAVGEPSTRRDATQSHER